MEARREELDIRWQDVAVAGGISVRALQTARHGTTEIRGHTQAGIERGLRWAPGSVAAILDGGEPTPVPAGSITLDTARPGRSAASPPDGQWVPPVSSQALADARPYADEIYRRLLELARQGVQRPTGEQLFPGNEDDAATWDLRADLFGEDERVWLIAEAHRREAAAYDRREGTG